MDALGGGVIWRKKKEKRADGRRLDRSARVFYPRARGVGDEPKGRAALRSRERDRKVYCRRGGREKSEREREIVRSTPREGEMRITRAGRKIYRALQKILPDWRVGDTR